MSCVLKVVSLVSYYVTFNFYYKIIVITNMAATRCACWVEMHDGLLILAGPDACLTRHGILRELV